MDAMSAETDRSEFLWRQYNMSIELYKFYVDAFIKVNVFHYAVTGGILSFVLTQAQADYVSFALLLPALLCFGLSQIFRLGLPPLRALQDDIESTKEHFHFKARPNVSPLAHILKIFSLLHLITGVVLFGLAFYL